MIRITDPEVQSFETKHIAAVRRLAPECTVLLAYDGVSFPVKAGPVAVYGNGARHTIKGGTGSGDVNVRHYVSAVEGLENAGFTITSGSWLDAYDEVLGKAEAAFQEEIAKVVAERGLMASFGLTMAQPDYDLPIDGEGDTALYVLARNSGEGSDRKNIAGDIRLTDTEIRDIKACAAKYAHFMLVLNVGGLIDLTPVVDDVKNILLLSQLGTPTGDVLADIVTGASYPSGRLTMTWAPLENYPSTEGFGDLTDTRYTEGVFVGYRWFDTFKTAHTYPFGFGLGYTTFRHTAVSFVADESKVQVMAQVRNTGARAGKETLQLYVSAPDGILPKPAKELVAYAKTEELRPGADQQVTLSFDPKMMASYDAARAAYILEPGVYDVLLGTDADHVTSVGKLALNSEVITSKLHNIAGKADFEDITPPAPKAAVSADGAVVLNADAFVTEEVSYASPYPAEMEGKEGTFDDVRSGKITLDEFIGTLTDEELADLMVGSHATAEDFLAVVGNAASHLAGAAGETTNNLLSKGVPVLTMPDGPAGLRLANSYVLRNGMAAPLDHTFRPEQAAKAEPGEAIYYQYCIAIPIGTALAQSWNDAVTRACGYMVGNEMEQFGAHLWLAPAMNIYRSPLCGRNFEYYSEDPLISGNTAAAMTEGVQSHKGCATVIKHYCCNNQETNRMHNNSIVSERALREIYLKGFEYCIRRSQPKSVMSSYNLVNGTHTNNRYCLQTMALRDEWGFKGFVMTDWMTTSSMPGDENQRWPSSSPAGNTFAGNDMVMPGMTSDVKDILNALKDEKHPYHVTRGILQRNAKHILQVVLDLT